VRYPRLVGYWKMDEGVGSSTYDYSGSNATGTWTGTPSGTINTYYTAGNVESYAGVFNGSNDNVAVPSSAALNPTNAITVMAWIDPFAWNLGFQTAISKRTNGGGFPGWSIAVGGSGSALYVWASAATVSITNASPTSTWQHVAFTYDGTNITTYFNGVKTVSTAAASFTSSANPLYIGSDTTSGGRNFNGLIDDVRIYNRALSAAEIQSIYNGGK
jgi:hypothetical protein